MASPVSITGCICARRVQHWTDDAHCLTCDRDLTESQIQDVVRSVLCAGGTGIVLWRNNIGTATFTDRKLMDVVRAVARGTGSLDMLRAALASSRGAVPVVYGVGNPGGADLIGCARGRFLAVETKARIGRQSPAQQDFQRIVESLGGIYAIVRSEGQAKALLDRLRTA